MQTESQEKNISVQTMMEWSGAHCLQLVCQLRATVARVAELTVQLKQAQEQNAELIKLLDERKEAAKPSAKE